ncbi:alpha/beta hydrolase [Flavobacterium sp. F-380]|uniref:Alpha/beta hydrolase n=1 Tax=Flavobacterium kayseriense TaxID=2764714 RepID=A0ABR7J8Y7_9FLAO|nr:alpha/beta hydrolase [Flavobacterium kayseriense]MBC5842009.1 alpha/beta hydrolase [Flavobacterium kayseriense]MBC5848538.1 alpha/beta hydrolase [Flavobacterium kayseriense]MBU0940843.1 alpha/beta hydrolase [Bacteroidota bacterium]
MKYLFRFLKIIISILIMVSIAITLIFGHKDIPLQELKTKYATASSSFIEVNEMQVHYRDEGDKMDSIPIVLIHGTAASLHTFDSWTNQLKNTNRVIRMDLPAYGLTGPFSHGNYSIENYTLFIQNFLDALKVKHCIIVGNSLGGEIAWNYTFKHPQRVDKLILIDATGYPVVSKSVPLAFQIGQTPVLNKILTYITPRFIVKSSIENIYYDATKVTPSLVDRYYELTLREGNRQAFIDRFAIVKDTNAYKKIKKINQPTLVLWGSNDLLIPIENAARFHTDLPNSMLHIIEKTGHTPMEESPIESLKPVLEFLKAKSTFK